MTTHFVDGIAVEVEGEGSPVVCIHGLGGTSNTWTPVMRAMRDHKVVRIELPGSGRSSAGVGELTIGRMVDAVIAACQRLDIGNAHFVGHSMGTIVCQHLAIKKPSLVKAMTLFGPLASPPEVARPNILARAKKAAAGGTVGMQEIADAIVSGTLSASTRETLPVSVAMVRESLMRQDAQGYSKSCEALAKVQAAALEDINVQVMLITGDEDPVAPPSTSYDMSSRLPKSRVVVLTRCGHWTTFERHAECTSLLEESIRRG
jgi:3-oxoadipate enol-lactonase